MDVTLAGALIGAGAACLGAVLAAGGSWSSVRFQSRLAGERYAQERRDALREKRLQAHQNLLSEIDLYVHLRGDSRTPDVPVGKVSTTGLVPVDDYPSGTHRFLRADFTTLGRALALVMLVASAPSANAAAEAVAAVRAAITLERKSRESGNDSAARRAGVEAIHAEDRASALIEAYRLRAREELDLAD